MWQYRVDPLDPSCDEWCAYPVASRPWAIQQWLESDDPKAEWVLMIETDYLFLKSALPTPRLPSPPSPPSHAPMPSSFLSFFLVPGL